GHNLLQPLRERRLFRYLVREVQSQASSGDHSASSICGPPAKAELPGFSQRIHILPGDSDQDSRPVIAVFGIGTRHGLEQVLRNHLSAGRIVIALIELHSWQYFDRHTEFLLIMANESIDLIFGSIANGDQIHVPEQQNYSGIAEVLDVFNGSVTALVAIAGVRSIFQEQLHDVCVPDVGSADQWCLAFSIWIV